MNCFRCGTPLVQDAVFCHKCGATQREAPRYAPPQDPPGSGQAGEPSSSQADSQAYTYQATYQSGSGHSYTYQAGSAPGYTSEPKSALTALLLCIFIGVLGIHRFYLGKVGTGLLWLFTGGLFGIGWLVDVIMIATSSMRDAWGRPLRW